MNYTIYRMAFTTPVHFGTGVLNESASSFCADTLFSALYIEAMKLGRADALLDFVEKDQLLLSDAFPYMQERYFLPKPMLYVEPKEQGDSGLKKQFKKLRYIPVEKLGSFLSGTLDPRGCSLHGLGREYSQVMAAVRREEDTLPYRVGNFLFQEDCGLYVLTATENGEVQQLFETLMKSLSYTGIGGKRGSGKGRFVLKKGKIPKSLEAMLDKESGRYLLLSTALPREEEIETALTDASYLLQRRSGFVYSETHGPELMKKRDMYTLQAGSCFRNRFRGAVYDVNEGGSHAVYRYGKGLFLGV